MRSSGQGSSLIPSVTTYMSMFYIHVESYPFSMCLNIAWLYHEVAHFLTIYYSSKLVNTWYKFYLETEFVNKFCH